LSYEADHITYPVLAGERAFAIALPGRPGADGNVMCAAAQSAGDIRLGEALAPRAAGTGVMGRHGELAR
jgi:hypothetical protein